MVERFQLRLVDSHMLAPSVRHLSFVRVDDKPLPLTPGQFMQVHFHYADGTPTKRSYSVATVGDGVSPVPHVEIAVSYVDGGAATELLGQLPTGGVVDASGPYGRFCLQAADTNQRYLFIATGTGITPYRAMLPQVGKMLTETEREVVLVHGARSERELLYDAEFTAFAEAHPRFTIYNCLSREPRATPRPTDRAGHVQVALAEIVPQAGRDIAYLCGNPDMVDSAFAALKEAGLPIAHIRREKYISSR